MTLTTPPRRPEVRPREDDDPLEALIREARRRARRRRLLVGGAALLAGVAAFAAYLGFRSNGGSPTAPPGGASPSANASPSHARARHNGALTLIALPEVLRTGDVPPGWYGVSTIDSTGTLHPLVRCPHRDRWCGEVAGVAWSRDGSRLAISVTSIVLPNPYNGLHFIDARNGADRQVYHCDACTWQDLDWSPDGTRLAGVEDFQSVGESRIIVINADGSESRYLDWRAPLPQSSPSWSPSGRFIAFAGGSGRRSAVYVLSDDGTKLRRLALGSAPAWSPRGNEIVYRSRCGLRLVTAQGTDITPPSPFKCDAIRVLGKPVWSPDGQRIAVSGTSRFGTGRAVRGTWVVNADGTGLKLVTDAVGSTFGGTPRPAWQPIP